MHNSFTFYSIIQNWELPPLLTHIALSPQHTPLETCSHGCAYYCLQRFSLWRINPVVVSLYFAPITSSQANLLWNIRNGKGEVLDGGNATVKEQYILFELNLITFYTWGTLGIHLACCTGVINFLRVEPREVRRPTEWQRERERWSERAGGRSESNCETIHGTRGYVTVRVAECYEVIYTE